MRGFLQVEHGADVNVEKKTEDASYTPLFAAIRSASRTSRDSNTSNYCVAVIGFYILLCSKENRTMVEFLLNKGADPTYRDFKSLETCLHVAAQISGTRNLVTVPVPTCFSYI